MIDALGYLYVTSFRNAVVARLKRLRQPKYAIGALAGLAYVYFFVFRQAFRDIHRSQSATGPAFSAVDFLPEASLILLLIVLFAWLWPRQRAALKFTEPEVAFLFAAPVSRRALIHAKLLRAQFGIVLTAIIFGFVLRRGSTLGGNAILHTIGWWVAFSTLNLHFLGASFTRERWLDVPLHPWLKTLLSAAVAVTCAAVLIWLIGQSLPPTTRVSADAAALLNALHLSLSRAPVSWLLEPLQWLLRPYFATGLSDFLLVLVPALTLLLLHYFWVIRANVAFEEASIALAAKHAKRQAEWRQGHARFGRERPLKPRTQPFALAGHGWRPLAFLWSNLIALGPFYRLRTVAILGALIVFGMHWLAADPARLPIISVLSVSALVIGAWAIVIGPVFMGRQAQQLLQRLEFCKAYPLPGWQLIVGQLLTPLTLISIAQWLLLLIAVTGFGYVEATPKLALLSGAAGSAGIALLTPPLCGLLLCVPFAGVLYFPAWAVATGDGPAGMEVMGQRILSLAAFLIVALLALLPTAIVGGLTFLAVQFLLGTTPAVLAAALISSAILLAELAAIVYWLGQKIERFDLSVELQR